MKFKRVTAFLLGSVLLLSSMSVLAETSVSSKASIEFTEGSGPTKPVDPDTGDPDPEEPGVGGSLSIVKVSDFEFSGEITSGKAFYDVNTERPNIQVVDIRGNEKGWTLEAKLSPFTDDQENPSLSGAAIHIKDGRLNSATDMNYAPEVAKGALLTSDNEIVEIMTAAEGKGMGLWIERFYPEDENDDAFVKLEVPASAIKADSKYSASITWILKTAP